MFNELCSLRKERSKRCDEGDQYLLEIQKILSRVAALRLNATELDSPEEKYKINEESHKT